MNRSESIAYVQSKNSQGDYTINVKKAFLFGEGKARQQRWSFILYSPLRFYMIIPTVRTKKK